MEIESYASEALCHPELNTKDVAASRRFVSDPQGAVFCVVEPS